MPPSLLLYFLHLFVITEVLDSYHEIRAPHTVVRSEERRAIPVSSGHSFLKSKRVVGEHHVAFRIRHLIRLYQRIRPSSYLQSIPLGKVKLNSK